MDPPHLISSTHEFHVQGRTVETLPPTFKRRSKPRGSMRTITAIQKRSGVHTSTRIAKRQANNLLHAIGKITLV